MPLLPSRANGSAEPSLDGHQPDERELLWRAVEGAKLAAEEASRASSAVADLRAVIGDEPQPLEIARAEAGFVSLAELEAWRSHGLRGQVALVLASMRAEARAASQQRRTLGLVTIAAAILPEVIRALGGY
jgi:hypothetical protein